MIFGFGFLSVIISRSICVAAKGIISLFYGWLIFWYRYVPRLYPVICWRILKLLPCLGYCKYCHGEHLNHDLGENSLFVDLKDTTSSWCKRVNCCSLNFWHLKGPQSLGDPSGSRVQEAYTNRLIKTKVGFLKELGSQLKSALGWMSVSQREEHESCWEKSACFSYPEFILHSSSGPVAPRFSSASPFSLSASVLPAVSIPLPSLLLSPLPSLCLNSSLLGVWPGPPRDTFRLWDSVPYQMRPLLKSSRCAVPLREPLSLVHLLQPVQESLTLKLVS